MHLRWGLVQLALLCCTLPFHAQTVSNEGQAPAATFKAETRAVDVDIVVLDRHGEPVKGLRQEDFVVTEDGSPQASKFFEEHTAETPQGDAATNALATNVLLIDTLNTPKEDSIYVRARVGSFLKSMPPGTSLAVFSLGQTLRMVQGFTSDRAMLLAAVDDNKTGAWSETSAASNMPLDDVDDRMRAQEIATVNPIAGNTHMVENAQAMHKTYQNDQRIAMTVAALQRLARYLAKTPGRKNLIWFSSAFPAAVFPDPNPRASLMQTMTTDHDRQIRETTNLLALARVAIYPVQGQGIAAQTTGDVNDHFGSQQRPLPGAPTGEMQPSATYEQNSNGDNYSVGALSKGLKQEDSAHATNDAAMQALASDTGGQVLPASNDLSGVLARAIRNGSQYYSLSYTPTNRKADGSFRRIEVKLRNGNDRLAYRRGYYATDAMLGPPPRTSASVAKSATPAGDPLTPDPLTPLMRSGMAPSQQVSYEVHVQPAAQQPAADAPRAGSNTRLNGPVTRYRVDFRIHREVLQQEAAVRPDKMQVEAIVYDASGKALNWVAGNMNLDATNDATAQQSGASMRNIRTQIEIDVPKEATSIVTGVYDWRTGSAGTQPVSFSSLAQTDTMQQPGSPAPAQGQSPPAASKNPASQTPTLLQRPPATETQTH